MGFRRQSPIGRYIADFVCHEARLILEVDGGQHGSGEQKRRDEVRDRWFVEHGYRTLRVWKNDVLQNLEGVLEVILLACR